MNVLRPPRDERGFVLTFVIFTLAALSVGATAAFLVVQAESRMAAGAAEGAKAFQLAQAGLTRYMAEAVGTDPDSAVYTFGGGTIVVRADKVLDVTPTSELYLVTSRAAVVDPRMPKLPARRSVRQFATLDLTPVNIPGAVTLFDDRVEVKSGASIDGRDQAGSEACGPGPVAGIIALDGGWIHTSESAVEGDPEERKESVEDLTAALGTDWAMLTHPAFPYDYSSIPNFFALPANEYPTIRIDGDLMASGSGRGLLVVTGRVTFGDDFTWDGTILTGQASDVRVSDDDSEIVINGGLIMGLDPAADAGPGKTTIGEGVDIQYNSCHVLDAAAGLAQLEALDNTWWESGF